MSAAARRLLVGGNWKSNGSKKFVKDFSKTVLNTIKYDTNKVEIVVAPVSIHLKEAQEHISNGVHIASQNMSAFPDGAYTGEISATQLVDFGINWTILGHSERRHILGESNSFVGTKVKMADDYGLKIIACIGEQLDERESGKTMQVCEDQLNAIREHLEDWSNIVIAYEPVWAIGTGVVASSEQAQEVHANLRQWLLKNVSQEAADQTRILYGGSVSEKNADELITNPDIDGFLVGGASLKPAFNDIIQACNNAQK
jgi:triosephosphate isomerase